MCNFKWIFPGSKKGSVSRDRRDKHGHFPIHRGVGGFTRGLRLEPGVQMGVPEQPGASKSPQGPHPGEQQFHNPSYMQHSLIFNYKFNCKLILDILRDDDIFETN